MTFGIVAVVLAASASPQTWKFKTGAEPEVSVSNIAGLVSVEGTPGDEVLVEASITGGSTDSWKVEVKQDGSKVRARACCGECDSHHGDCNNNGAVEFKIKVPQKAALHVNGVSSSIEAKGIAGAEEIRSVSGAIQVSGAEGVINVRSVSGKVTIAPKTMKETNVHTVSGDVQISLPRDSDISVQMSTVSGRFNGEHVGIGSTEKSFGKGTGRVHVKTVSGSVRAEPVS